MTQPAPGPVAVTLPDAHEWLRVAAADWSDPLDPQFAARRGGRWNPPDSFPVLYLNADLRTARAQVRALFAGWPVNVEDLAPDAPYVLVRAALPARQRGADAVTDAGLRALGLPASYPRDGRGRPIGRVRCQPIGAAVAAAGLRGVQCRSAATPDGSGRELAWFPARGARAHQISAPVPFTQWWGAASVTASKAPG